MSKHVDELWEDIDGFPNYQVSTLGNIRSKKSLKALSMYPSKTGYYHVGLYNDTQRVNLYVHRLVAKAFCDRFDESLEVNHIDGDKSNNRSDNLEWVTKSDNTKHAYRLGLKQTPESLGNPKTKIRIVETGETFDSIRECARAIGADHKSISECINPESTRVSSKGMHFEKVVESPKKSKPFLYDYQADAVRKMRNGVILNGGVGSGKSRTGLYYYFKENGGSFVDHEYIPMKNPQDLYIITTAMKRDSKEWLGELAQYQMWDTPDKNFYDNTVVIDSWNNIKKYIDVKGAFFIFDEDRVTGTGAWVKAFYKITKTNNWIILSATPGDTWKDYMPVFIANGFYRNKTEFDREHVVYVRGPSYPIIDRYIATGRLERLRNQILIDMDFQRHTVRHDEPIYVKYDISMYKDTIRTRTNPYIRGYIPCLQTDFGALCIGSDIDITEVDPIMSGWDYTPEYGDYVRLTNRPLLNASALCYTLRKIVNTDESRQKALLELLENHPKAIIFYNFDYELDILKGLYYGEGVGIAEWNGHAHEEIPTGDRWVYFVQYTAGAEGWNCTATDTIIFYSQNYSFRTVEQAKGRIDRLNTPYRDLYYYHLKTRSGIDLAISKALDTKKKFNERKWVKW